VSRPPTGTVVVQQRQRGIVFSIRYRAAGRRWYETLDVATREEAEQALADALSDVRRGLWRPPTAAPVAELPTEVPSFHLFSSEWVERRRREVRPRTLEHWTWLLSCHLLPFFATYQLDTITVELVDRFKVAKLQERELWQQATPEERKEEAIAMGLNAGSINKALALLSRILDDAREYGHVPANAAAGKKRRLAAPKPRRTWLELHEVNAVLDCAGKRYRPLLATMILAGLRVSEATSLRWAGVDLAGAKLQVVAAKTDAGVRVVDVSPMLLDELKAHKANADCSAPTDLVFSTRNGTELNRNNVRVRALGKAVERASAKLVAAGLPPIADGVTNHSLRRTFASLLYEAGASPAYVMAQMGHTSPGLALEVYAKKMSRSRDTGARMDALIRGADWAPMGTTAAHAGSLLAVGETERAT
jgi:integrase